MRFLTFISLGLIACIALTSAAQPAACPAVVAQALASAGESCGNLGRNQVCYGSIKLTVTPRDPAAELDFAAPGDRLSLADVESLELAELAPDVPEWGVALMTLQANLPDNLPGQNVTAVLFGDVTFTGGESAAPIQAFTLRTGIGAPACGEAPSSGIVIQTPDGVGEVEFTINGVGIRLGSTAVVRAAPGDSMRFTILEGFSTLSLGEQSQQVLPFKTAVIPLDADGAPLGEIGLEDALPADYASLPLDLLPREVKTPPAETGGTPFAASVMAPESTAEPLAGSTPPLAGKWSYETTDIDTTACPNGSGTTGTTGTETLTLNADGTFAMFGLVFEQSQGVWRGGSREVSSGFTADNAYEVVFDGDRATTVLTSQITNSALGDCTIRFTAEMQHIE